MVKEMKRKLFVCLLALVLIVTLMPAAAFAENIRGSGDSIEGDGPQAESRKLLCVAMYGETENDIISQANAQQARFELEKIEEVPTPLSADSSANSATSVSLYYEEGKSYIDLTNYADGIYRLSEIKAPTDYSLSGDKYTIQLNSDVISQKVEGGEYAPIRDAGLKFHHDELIKIKVPIRKIVKSVGAAAPENARFTAKLSAVSLGGDGPAEKVLLGTSEKFGATQGTDPQLLTFSVDRNYTDGWFFVLEETDADEAGWTYDERIYGLMPESDERSLGDENGTDDKNKLYNVIYELDSDYNAKSEVPTNVATFTNIYTANNGGGGSHTRYYNIKVNGGKALDFLGSEVTRASSGSTIQVQADAAAEGKVFKGWEVVQGGITAGEASDFSFIMPRANVELTAVYEDTAVKEPDIEEPEDPSEPEQPDEDAEEQKETPVPKTGDSMTMELMLFAVLAAGAAFGMKKAYNKTK